MKLSVSLTARAEAELREKAAARGQQLEAYASQFLERAVLSDLNEQLTPFREQVAESGMTDAELDDFFEELREKAYHDRISLM